MTLPQPITARQTSAYKNVTQVNLEYHNLLNKALRSKISLHHKQKNWKKVTCVSLGSGQLGVSAPWTVTPTVLTADDWQYEVLIFNMWNITFLRQKNNNINNRSNRSMAL